MCLFWLVKVVWPIAWLLIISSSISHCSAHSSSFKAQSLPHMPRSRLSFVSQDYTTRAEPVASLKRRQRSSEIGYSMERLCPKQTRQGPHLAAIATESRPARTTVCAKIIPVACHRWEQSLQHLLSLRLPNRCRRRKVGSEQSFQASSLLLSILV